MKKEEPVGEILVYMIRLRNGDHISLLFSTEQSAHAYAYQHGISGKDYIVYPMKLPMDIIESTEFQPVEF